jgi:GH24 family phage-related lysozyme (muramidase)
MKVLYEIGNEDCLLKITKRGDKLSVTCGVATIGWGEQGKSTLEETLKDQEKQIARHLQKLDKTNRSSKKGLQFLLKELSKERQLELF